MNANKTKKIGYLLGLVMLMVVASARADSISVTYEVLRKAPGYVSFLIKAENISLVPLYGVTLEADDGVVAGMSYGDIAPGEVASKEVVLTWNVSEEPPTLNWIARYTDALGKAIEEAH